VVRIPIFLASLGLVAFISLLAWLVWTGYQNTEDALKANLNLLLRDNNLANQAVLTGKVQRLEDLSGWIRGPEDLAFHREKCTTASAAGCFSGLVSSAELLSDTSKATAPDCGQFELLHSLSKDTTQPYKIGPTKWMPTGMTMAPIAHVLANGSDWIAACFKVDTIRDIWRSLELPKKSSMALVRGTDYHLWIREPFKPELLGRDLSDGPLVAAMIDQAPSPHGIADIIATKTDFVARTVQWSPIGVDDLILVAGYPKNHVYDTWLEREWPHLTTLGILAAVIIALASFSWITIQRKYQETKKLNVKVEEREARLGAIIDNSADGIISISETGKIHIANVAACSMFGYNQAELVGKNVNILLPKDERHEHDTYIRKSELYQSRVINQVRDLFGLNKDGTLFPIELNVSRVQVSHERMFVGIIRDISERKKHERELQLSRERFKTSQSFANIGTWEWNIQTGALYWSDQSHKLYGGPEGELETSYENFISALHPDDRNMVTEAIQVCIDDHVACDIEHRVVWPDGKIRWLHETGNVERNNDGEPIRMLGIVRDVTELKELLDNLEVTKLKSETASRAKSDFLANMSHELRTPLNAIIGFSQTFQSQLFGPLGNEKYLEYADDINSSSNHLLELINDILDVSAIESEAMELNEENIDVARIVEEAVRICTPSAERGRVEVSTFMEADPLVVLADGRRVRQVMLNLLNNAVKFTPEGGKVIVDSLLNNDGSYSIYVSDTGSGMNNEEVDIALSKFGQVDSGLDRKYEGTGLGLPLTKGLMELHGGTLEIDSLEGYGTMITATFPKERVI